jgi:uncharacterized membrane protein
MSLDFEHSIEIDRPAADVFAFVADFSNNPRWQGGMKSCHWTSEEPMVVGATYVQQASFLGRRIDTHFCVTELVAGSRISIESTKSTFPIQVTRSVESLADDRCRVTAHIRGQPTGVLKLFGGMVKKTVAKDYRQLKKLLESR